MKNRIAVEFNLLDAEIIVNAGEVAYIYPLNVQNRTDQALTARLDADSAHTLKYFSVDAPTSIALAPHEKKTVPLRLHISRQQAMLLPALYSEPLYPQVSLDGIDDSDVIPLMGYRRWPMWASVPVFNRTHWIPAATQATVNAWKPFVPWVDQWITNVVRAGDVALGQDWPLPPRELLPTGFDQSYRCNDCGVWLQPVERTNFYKHTCPQCKAVFENNQTYNKSYVSHYVSQYATTVRTLGLAYQLTGQENYLQKAAALLTAYADAAPTIPITGYRSTSGGSHLKMNTLHSSYALQPMAAGYDFIRDASTLNEQTKTQIERFLNEEAFRLARHGSEYNNQGAEHFHAYGSTGFATGYWPLTAMAIYAEYNWHDMVENAFSEDGIGHEGGVYHNALVHAMGGFGIFAYNHGVNLMTARLKRVFDGTMSLGIESPIFELAYRTYREPAYLPMITQIRQRQNEVTLLCGVPGVPDATKIPVNSTVMEGSGYLFLRKGTASDFRELRLNYLQQFDRLEADRFTTFFYKNNAQIDAHVGRIAYSVPGSAWMAATPAHNSIVIDGQDAHEVNGRLIAADLSAETPVAVVSTLAEAPFYQGVQQIRGIALIDNAYIVFDRITADRPVTIDRYQYGKGQAALQCKVETIDTLSNLPAAGKFVSLQGGDCGKEVRIDFGGDLKMHLVSDKDIGAYKAITFGGYQGQTMEVTFVRAEKAREVTFLAAFVQGKEANPPQLRIKESTVTRQIFEVESKGTVYTISVDIANETVAVTAQAI